MTGEIESPGRAREIRRVLGAPEYRTLFSALRRRLEEAGDSARSVTVRNLQLSERKALAGLFEWKSVPGTTVRVDLRRLDERLRASRLGVGLREVVEVLGGPLVDRPALRREAQEAHEAFWEKARLHRTVQGRPELEGWLDELRSMGLLKRACRTGDPDEASLLGSALEVLARLPGEGLMLGVLAAEVTGDAHALDAGRPLAGIVLRGVARLAGQEDFPVSSLGRRHLWSRAGVLCDPLSSHVLTFGLLPLGGCRLSRCLRDATESGDPVRISLRELTLHPLALPAGTPVHVCENPAVVATAADRLAGRCRPTVCTEGVPSVAARLLLKQLREEGAEVRFHCDFDWGGVRIGNMLVEEVAATPWRFSRRDYEHNTKLDEDLPELKGVPADALWDRDLTACMIRVGKVLLEEHVIETLLADLAS